MTENTKLISDDLFQVNIADDVMGDTLVIGKSPSRDNTNIATGSDSNAKSRTKAPKESDWQHFSIICSKEIASKIKMLAVKEHFTIRSVVEKMLGDGLAAYERKYGSLEVSNRSIDDLY